MRLTLMVYADNHVKDVKVNNDGGMFHRKTKNSNN